MKSSHIKTLLKTGALQNAIFNSTYFSIIATDEKGVIQIFNIGAERMLGYTAVEVVNKITPADISDPQEMIVRAQTLSIELGTSIAPGFEALVFKASHNIEDIYELTYIRKDNSRFPAIVSITALHNAETKIIGYLLIGTDNTARKQFELALQKNNIELENAKAIAEKSNLAKSDFLSSMSHELRTPLNAVLGFAQLLASETPPPSTTQQLAIDQILHAGWYLLRLINEILDLALIESGKVSISQESMSLTSVLKDCQSMIEPQAQMQMIEMTFPSFDKEFYVFADNTRVKQVIINLLSNAIKYNRVGGKVKVQCVMTRENRVRVSVEDNGAGLTQEQLTQLFQPFNRLGQENSAEVGTGIGLVVTKQLVELMDGTIGVESRVGIGSTFWFELNASPVPKSVLNIIDTKNQLLLPTQESSTHNILLCVEDNPANLTLVEQLMTRRNDIKLLTAIDGNSGIQIARTFRPDVILMDINLPDISGTTALQILRKDPLTAHIPVIALSANAIPREVEKGLEAGFFRYLTKPINVVEFMEAIDVAMLYSARNSKSVKMP